MKRVFLVLGLVCVVQPAFAQEMNVWRTESAVGVGDSGRGGGGNQVDSRVKSVSRAVGRANVGKTPGVKVRPWLRGVMNGSSDSSGEVLVVSRTRHSDLVDNRNPAKLKVKRLPKHAESNAMGKTHVSPDGKVALVADEGTRQQIVELATGRVLAEGRASGSRFVGQSTIYWWVEMQAQGRVNYRNERDGVNGSWSAGELTRLDW